MRDLEQTACQPPAPRRSGPAHESRPFAALEARALWHIVTRADPMLRLSATSPPTVEWRRARRRHAAIAPDGRDAYERLSASILSKIELPAIFGSILSGIAFVAQSPLFLKQGWLHGKLICVLLAVLSHVEMFNARSIVRHASRAPPAPPTTSPSERRGTQRPEASARCWPFSCSWSRSCAWAPSRGDHDLPFTSPRLDELYDLRHESRSRRLGHRFAQHAAHHPVRGDGGVAAPITTDESLHQP